MRPTTKSSGKKITAVEKKKVGRPFGCKKNAQSKVITTEIPKKGKVGRPIGWRKNKSGNSAAITTTIEQFKKGLEEKQQIKDFGESINTFMSRVGGVLHRYLLVVGEREIKIEISPTKQVRATHNFLGYWEDIPTSFHISFKTDSDDVVKRVVIKQQGSDKNLIIMDNPTIIRMNWEEEHTI